jgi:hypothetical protein
MPPNMHSKMIMGAAKGAAVMLQSSGLYLGIAVGLESALSTSFRARGARSRRILLE